MGGSVWMRFEVEGRIRGCVGESGEGVGWVYECWVSVESELREWYVGESGKGVEWVYECWVSVESGLCEWYVGESGKGVGWVYECWVSIEIGLCEWCVEDVQDQWALTMW